MGPPDKREPKMSDNRFERTSMTSNNSEMIHIVKPKESISSTITTSAINKISDGNQVIIEVQSWYYISYKKMFFEFTKTINNH